MKRGIFNGKTVCAAIAAAVVCICSFVWLIQSSLQISTESALKINSLYLNELTANTISHFGTALEYNFASLEATAETAKNADIQSREELESFLGRTKNIYGFSFLALVDEKGYCHNEDGDFPAMSKISFLGDLLSGGKNLISYNETIHGDNMLMLGTSIEPVNCMGEKFIGVIIGITSSKLNEQLSLREYGANTASSIVAKDGSYVINNSANMSLPAGANIFTQLDKYAVFDEGYSVSKIKSDFSSDKSDIVCYEMDGKQHYIYYVPVPDTDWFMLTTISYSVVNENVNNMRSRLVRNAFTAFFLTMGVILAIFSFYCAAMSRKEKELTEAKILAENSKERAEQALDIARVANNSKSAFLANMSHDIRTPMNAIIGLSTLIDKDAENPQKVREHLKKINASGQHLMSMINDVLDMSKIESGKTALNIGEFCLAETVSEVAAIIRPEAKAKQQSFKINTEQLRHECVLGDKIKINQILINLLSNAVKYTQTGGQITLKIAEKSYKAGGYSLFAFEVEDNGCGMQKEYLEKIFEPFTRAEDSVTNKIQGTGLGMAITKNLVDLMGGTLSVKSSPGQGSVFTVELEMHLQDVNADTEFWRTNGIGRVLIADDETEICINAAELMKESGIKAEYAISGHEAVKMAENAEKSGRGFDVVLLDRKMPDMDGTEAAEAIRKNTDGGKPPIIIFTSFSHGDDIEKALEAGADGFMPKPFFMSNLKQTIERITYRSTNAAKAEEKSILAGRHFLAAEDNELNAEILTDLLDAEGAEVDIAENGSKAVKMFEESAEGQYDAILMDVQMPVMNGYEATKIIRGSSHPMASKIPIIALTANAFTEDVHEALASGMNAHVSKPVSMEQLEATLRKLLKQQVH